MKITKRQIISSLLFFFIFFLAFNILISAPIVRADEDLWDKQVGTDEIKQAFQDSEEPMDLRDVVVKVIRIFLSFLALIFVILIIWGGYKWMTSLGNEDKVREAKAQIKAAIWGLVIIMLSYAITEFINYLITDRIFDRW
jgi:ABC-type uncharacterized transport system permease subunit